MRMRLHRRNIYFPEITTTHPSLFLGNVYQRIKLKPSVGKGKVMRVGNSDRQFPFSVRLNGEEFEIMSEFK